MDERVSELTSIVFGRRPIILRGLCTQSSSRRIVEALPENRVLRRHPDNAAPFLIHTDWNIGGPRRLRTRIEACSLENRWRRRFLLVSQPVLGPRAQTK